MLRELVDELRWPKSGFLPLYRCFSALAALCHYIQTFITPVAICIQAGWRFWLLSASSSSVLLQQWVYGRCATPLRAHLALSFQVGSAVMFSLFMLRMWLAGMVEHHANMRMRRIQ